MAAPTITSFSPSTGPAGTVVTVVGTNLTSASSVLLHDVQCTIVGTTTGVQLQFVVPVVPLVAAKFAITDDADSAIVYSATNFTPTASLSTSALATNVAKKWRLRVDTSTAQDGSNYVNVRAVTNFQYMISPTSVDDSDYDSGVWGSNTVTRLDWSLVFECDRKTSAGYAYDPGQEAIRLPSYNTGSAAVVRVAWNDRNGGEAYEGYGNVQWSEKGGSTTDKDSVSVTIVGRGAPVSITNVLNA